MRSKQPVGGLRRQPLVDAEHRGGTRDRARCASACRGTGGSCAAKRCQILRASGLHLARRRRRGIARSSSAHALAVQHPEHVVIRRDEQRRRRSANGASSANHCGIGVPVRAHDRQILHRARRAGARGCASRRSAGNSRSAWRFRGIAMIGPRESSNGHATPRWRASVICAPSRE